MEEKSLLLSALFEELERHGLGREGWTGAFAPGRLCLIGAHVDHSGGHVITIALEKGTVVLSRKAESGPWKFLSATEGMIALPELPEEGGSAGWADYVIGVIKFLGREKGISFENPLEIAVHGDLPVGAGLSSSASLSVASVLSLACLAGFRLSAKEMADVAYKAEHDFKGVACGIQDQYSVSFAEYGYAFYLKCLDIQWEFIPFPSNEVEIALCDTGIPRSLAKSEFNARVSQCWEAYEFLCKRIGKRPSLASFEPGEIEDLKTIMPVPLWKRAMHVSTETRRVEQAALRLMDKDLTGFCRLLEQSYASSRDFYESTIPELDFLVSTALRHEACLGARISGGGFGGAIFAVLKPGSFDDFMEFISGKYLERFKRPSRVTKLLPGHKARELESLF